ncbi:MAG TPA: hypothetical protein VNR42_02440 [Solirubrobacteraceae bacterium]|nr:hypothetical protein [Solirubrobacteraceae bacterium]
MEADLKAQGCRASGYRLLGNDGNWSPYCCKHLYGRWRVITTFEPGIATVTAVGKHDGPGFYTQLSHELGISGVGRGRDQKPACCGPDGWPTTGNLAGKPALTARDDEPSAPAEGPR